MGRGGRLNESYAAWKAAQGEDVHKATKTFVTWLTQSAHGICYRICPTGIDEVVNDCVHIALRSDNGFDSRSRFSTWFHGVCTRRATVEMHERRGRRGHDANRPTYSETPFEEDRHSELSLGLLDIELRETLSKALTERELEVLDCMVHGYTSKEAAPELGVSERRARQLMQVVRDKVKEALLV